MNTSNQANLIAVGDFGGSVTLCKVANDNKNDEKFKQALRFLKEEMLLMKEFNNI